MSEGNPGLPFWDLRDGVCLLAALALVQLAALGAGEVLGPLVWLPLLPAAAVAANLFIVKRPLRPYDRILSAFSVDGIHWQKEPGVRLDVGGPQRSRQVYSPCVVPAAGGWRMFHRGGGYRSHILSAFSRDGLAWQVEAGQRVGSGDGLTRVDFPSVVAVEGGWRMYFAASDGGGWRIYSAQSQDQLSWAARQVAVDMGGCRDFPHAIDPTVVAVDDGWRMVFTAFGAAENRFYTAHSADGVAWSRPVECRGFDPARTNLRNPCILRLANGELYLYFSEYGASIVGAHIACATSADGVAWRRREGVRLAGGGPFDRHGVFCPAIAQVEGGWRMYYGGYWGRHWGEWLTLRRHRRAARAPGP